MAYDKTKPADGTDCASVDNEIRLNFVAIEAALGSGTLAAGLTIIQGNILHGTASNTLSVLAPGSDGDVLESGGGGADINWATVAVKDYASSTSSGTAKTLSQLKIVYGYCSVAGSSTTQITNLPFTSSTSFSVSVTLTAASTSHTANRAIINSASAFTIYNDQAGADTVSWVAIGT